MIGNTFCKTKQTPLITNKRIVRQKEPFFSNGGATHYDKQKYTSKKMKPGSRKYERSSKLFDVLIYT